MPRIFPRREGAPALFTAFCGDWLGLPVSYTALWWQALQRARWSRAVGLRSMVQAQSGLATHWREVVTMYESAMAPRELVTILEELIAENLLSPLPARRIEEAVLSKTDRQGAWR